MLLQCLFAASIVWTGIAPERLYHCSDDMPILTAIPPFVHGSGLGDYFIVSPGIVYFTWFAFLAAAVLLPAFPIVFFQMAAQTLSKTGLLREVN